MRALASRIVIFAKLS